jgi:uncharacterized membrane protein
VTAQDQEPGAAADRHVGLPAKQPISVLAGRYGHPLHPVLVPVPIGAWVAALVFDVASHVATDGGFLVRAAYWLVALGVLGALAAALLGFLDLLVIPGATRVYRVALLHLSVNLVVTTVFGVELALRKDSADPAGTPWWLVVLTAVALGGLAVGGYLGGELAYRYGVRVADETTQAEGYRPRHNGGRRSRWT